MAMFVNLLIEKLRVGTKLDRECAKLVEKSHKFVLDPGAISQEIRDGAFRYAQQLMVAEIFPMPFDSGVFEFGPTGLVQQDFSDLRLWVLAWREPESTQPCGWAVYFRAFAQIGSERGDIISYPLVGQAFTDAFNDDGTRGGFKTLVVDTESLDMLRAGMRLYRAGDPASVAAMRARVQNPVFKGLFSESEIANAWESALRQGAPDGEEEHIRWAERAVGVALDQLLQILGLMSTGSGIVQTVVRPQMKFINAKRVRKGEVPLDYEHTVVSIDPTVLRLPGVVAQGGTHASPRLHWRRGHIRTLQGGRKVQVRPCVVGDVSRGTVTHDYDIHPILH